ncbi:N-acetyltransferase [bacterium]|nr:N-acetyltransferase [bacterium]MDY2886560.1 N-acetyltransferase [Bariatricus sp.]
MIRRFENKDLDQVMSIWLQVNMESHSFIGADYWKDNYEMVKDMIPKAEVLVSEENGQIRGFIGLIDTYIAGIFVRAAEQSKGVGTGLLQTVMKSRDNLRLNVYKKNMRAVSFYQHYGFQIINQGIDESTSEEEYTMEWHR